jgi:hypothetical protein
VSSLSLLIARQKIIADYRQTEREGPTVIPHAPIDGDGLRRRARLAAGACRLVAVAVPALLLISWFRGGGQAAALARLGLPPEAAPEGLAALAAALIVTGPALLLAAALLAAAVCFDGFAGADWFGPRQPRALAAAGGRLAAAGALSLPTPTLLGLALTLGAPPGERMLVVGLSSQGVAAILFGALIWTLGRLWAVARDLAAENARFV